MFRYIYFKQQNWGLFTGKWLVIRRVAVVGVQVAGVGGGAALKACYICNNIIVNICFVP
jgi:hypothetical protein